MPRLTPMPRLTRRTLLVDLGRATLGAVVLGAAVGCTDDEPADGAAGGSPDGPATGSWQRASFGFVSAYVLVREGEAMVFDTGTGDDLAPLTGALAAAGSAWDDVGTVVVSHAHGDHVGGLDLVLAEAPAATVHAAEPDLEEFRDRAGDPVEVVDGDRVLGLTVVATPGHTPGHISLLDEEHGLLLVGDALVNDVEIGGTSGQGIELSPPQFTADADAAAASGRRLAGLSFDVALFGHGEPIVGGAGQQVATAVG